eukprot:SAG22_NODE_610_length_8597_cov_4.848906_2_plen_662_part_00
MRLSKTQQACRQRGLWPGGHKTELRDRLLRFEFNPRKLTDTDIHGPQGSPRPGGRAKGMSPRRKLSKDKKLSKGGGAGAAGQPLLVNRLMHDSAVTIDKIVKPVGLGDLAGELGANFVQNLTSFVKKYGCEVAVPAVEQELDEVLTEDYAGYRFKRCWVVQIEGAAADRMQLRIYENNAKKGCNHCTCSKWGEMPHTKSTYHVMVISESTLLERPVLALHGMLHANGFGHLIHVNGKEVGSAVSGTRLLDVWDGFCISVGARLVSVQDKSMKYGLHLRLIHALAYDHNWYGRWNYVFERGSYGNTFTDYRKALDLIRNMDIGALLKHEVASPPILTLLRQYHSADEIQQVSDLFRLTLDLLKSTRRDINKTVVASLLKDFTTSFLFGESHPEESAAEAPPRKVSPKRNMNVRKAAQVLLDCRWFVKDYGQYRQGGVPQVSGAAAGTARTSGGAASAATTAGAKAAKAPSKKQTHLRAWCSLPPHLDVQVCSITKQPIDEIVVPVDADLETLKAAAEKHFKAIYPPLSKFEARTIRFRDSTKPLAEHQIVQDIQRRRGLDIVFEIVGTGHNLNLVNGVDPSVKVQCVCGTCSDDGERMVACNACGTWLHTRCIGMHDAETIPGDYNLTDSLRVKCCKELKRGANRVPLPSVYYWGQEGGPPK